MLEKIKNTKVSEKKSIIVDSNNLKIELQNDSKDLEFHAQIDDEFKIVD